MKLEDLILNPEESLGLDARMTYRSFTRVLQSKLNGHSVPIGQWYYLRVLWREDGLTQKNLSDQLGIMGPTTVVALRAMEREGLVNRVRNAQDRRKINIFLTEKGKSLEKELSPYVEVINKLASVDISSEDLEVFRRVNGQIRENLQQKKKLKP